MQGVFHYHYMPVCLADSSLASNDKCISNCEDIKNYGIEGFKNNKTISPIGIAKDGHIVYGPYDDSGMLFKGEDVDVCNGLTIDGTYAYVSTSFHPYFVGCWGPGNKPTMD